MGIRSMLSKCHSNLSPFTPSNVTLFIGQLHRRTKVVALIPGNRVERLRLHLGVPQRILIEVVLAQAPVRLLVQADQVLAQGLGERHEAARLIQIMHGTPGSQSYLSPNYLATNPTTYHHQDH